MSRLKVCRISCRAFFCTSCELCLLRQVAGSCGELRGVCFLVFTEKTIGPATNTKYRGVAGGPCEKMIGAANN